MPKLYFTLHDGISSTPCLAIFGNSATIGELSTACSELLSLQSRLPLQARQSATAQWLSLDSTELLCRSGIRHGAHIRVDQEVALTNTNLMQLSGAPAYQTLVEAAQPHTTFETANTAPRLVEQYLSSQKAESEAASWQEEQSAVTQLRKQGNSRRTGGKIPLYSSLAPLLVALVLFQIVKSPFVLMFALLAPVMFLASLLDRMHGSKQTAATEITQLWGEKIFQHHREAVQEQYRKQLLLELLMPARIRALFLSADVTSFGLALNSNMNSLLWRLPPQIPVSLRMGKQIISESFKLVGERMEVLKAVAFVIGQIALNFGPERIQIKALDGVEIPHELSALLLLPHFCFGAGSHHTSAQTVYVGFEMTSNGNFAAQFTFNKAKPHFCKSPAAATISQNTSVISNDAATNQRLSVAASSRQEKRGRSLAALGDAKVLESLHCELLSLQNFDELCSLLSQYRPNEAKHNWWATNLPAVQNADTDALALQICRNWGDIVTSVQPYSAQINQEIIYSLLSDGPHLLIAGTTGAGKSELLQSLLASFAVLNAPNRLRFLLLDYKGGASFGEIADLPHCDGLVSDLDSKQISRVLAQLKVAIKQRESALATAAAQTIDEYNEKTGQRQNQMPRLLVVIDEFAALLLEHPEAESTVVDLCQRGRALGIHLVLSTQRAAGTVSDKIRANIDAKIVLRVNSETESKDLLGVPAAAHIARQSVGECYVRFGSQSVTPANFGSVNYQSPWSLQKFTVFPLAQLATVENLQNTENKSGNLLDESNPEKCAGLSHLINATKKLVHERPEFATNWPCSWIPELPEQLKNVPAKTIALAEDLESFSQYFLSLKELGRKILLIDESVVGKETVLNSIAALAQQEGTVCWLDEEVCKTRFELLRTCYRLIRYSQHKGAVCIISATHELQNYFVCGDKKVLRVMRELLELPQLQIITAVSKPGELPSSFLQLFDTKLLLKGDHSFYPVGSNSALKTAVKHFSNVNSGRAIDVTNSRLLQFCKYPPQISGNNFKVAGVVHEAELSKRGASATTNSQLAGAATECQPAKPLLWNLETGEQITVPTHGLVLVRHRNTQLLVRALQNLWKATRKNQVESLAVTDDAGRCPVSNLKTIAVEQIEAVTAVLQQNINSARQATPATTAAANANTAAGNTTAQVDCTSVVGDLSEHCFLIPDINYLLARKPLVLQQFLSAAVMQKAVVLAGALHAGLSAPALLQNLEPTMILELGITKDTVLHPLISIDADRFARFENNEGYCFLPAEGTKPSKCQPVRLDAETVEGLNA